VDIQTISELLRHRQITTPQIYAKMSDWERQKAVNKAFSGQQHIPKRTSVNIGQVGNSNP